MEAGAGEKEAAAKGVIDMRLSLYLAMASTPTLLFADVLELKTGERLEGTFVQATTEGAVITVAGQSITIPIAKMRAIYFGAIPVTEGDAKASVARESLDALRALQSITSSGVGYRDYAPRVLDARIKVDHYLKSAQENEKARAPISSAMRYYELAAQAWNTNLVTTSKSLGSTLEVFKALVEDKEVSECPALKSMLAEVRRSVPPFAKSPMDISGVMGTFLGQNRLPTLWACAKDKISEAETLLAIR